MLREFSRNELNSKVSIFMASFVGRQNTQMPFFTVLFSNWKENINVLKDIEDPCA